MRPLLKKLSLSLLGLVVLLPYTANAAAVVYDSRDYFAALATPKVVQNVNNLWTYHIGGANGALLSPALENYINPPGTNSTPLIGPLTTIGSNAGTSGYCPGQSAASFDGMWIHPGTSAPATVAFNAGQARHVDKVEIWAEGIANICLSNGISVDINSIIGGNSAQIGNFIFNASTDNNPDLNVRGIFNTYITDFDLAAGEQISFSFGNNGNFLYDHGNFRINIHTSDVVSSISTVSEPNIILFMGLSLVGMGILRRQRKDRK